MFEIMTNYFINEEKWLFDLDSSARQRSRKRKVEPAELRFPTGPHSLCSRVKLIIFLTFVKQVQLLRQKLIFSQILSQK